MLATIVFEDSLLKLIAPDRHPEIVVSIRQPLATTAVVTPADWLICPGNGVCPACCPSCMPMTLVQFGLEPYMSPPIQEQPAATIARLQTYDPSATQLENLQPGASTSQSTTPAVFGLR